MPETTEIDTYDHEDCISSRVLRSSPPPRRCLSSTLTPKGLTGLRQGHVSVAASRGLHVIHGDVAALPRGVRDYVEEKARVCAPDHVHVCDGSERENQLLMYVLQKDGILQPLPKMDNCWLARTDPADVARVESLTFISTDDKRDTIPEPKNGAKGQLGHWMAPADLDTELDKRFPGCMTGRTMFVIPFSMGPVGSPLAKIGVQLTDSAYVAASMRIMTRMGDQALQALGDQDFVKCLHSVGRPLPLTEPLNNSWPCAPSKVIVAHKPKDNEICSFGSGYGGNSLLGKKCFALRLGSIIGRREGWLAEHMLIMGIKNKKTGEKRYVAAAFPSACGKTNLAMMTPALEDYEITCVGDDIAWMKFDADGRLRAINPEAGFFGVAPGTSDRTNPMAMASIQANTVFTNVAATSDGGVYWDGLEDELKASGASVESWLGAPWTPESPKPAAHPNSRFCTPASQCPIMDEAWEAPEGVPIDAIIFGGRRPQGVPLVYEARSWQHGVFVGAAMRSEATAAAEHKAKVIMHDPFAMRPFFGYNFGDYLQHWLSLGKQDGVQLPKIFHVNWFRKSDQGGFLWPGFGENSRVLDWIVRRCADEDIAKSSAIGLVPKEGSINLDGLKEDVDMDALFSLPKDFWEAECDAIQTYFDDQVNDDLPPAVMAELRGLRSRVRDEL